MLKLFGKKDKLNKTANVYFVNGILILTTSHKAPNGIKFIATPIIKVPISSEKTLIGEYVRNVLDAYKEYKEDKELPNDMKVYMKGILKEMGFKSWKSLESPPTRACGISESAGTITFTPLRNSRGGKNSLSFQEFDADIISISTTCGNKDLGEALIKAFNASC